MRWGVLLVVASLATVVGEAVAQQPATDQRFAPPEVEVQYVEPAR